MSVFAATADTVGRYTPFLPDPTPGPPAKFYRLRAFDVGLGRKVYWASTSLDASQYTEGPGPLTGLVVVSKC